MVDSDAPESKPDRSLLFGGLAGAFFIWAVVVTVLLANKDGEASSEPSSAFDMLTSKSTLEGSNPCKDMNPLRPNVACMIEALDDGSDVTKVADGVGPQAGGNVTKGYNGQMEVDVVPITEAYNTKGLCPVNVHWHLGAEHYSAGEFDCLGHGDHDDHREMMEEDHKVCGPSEIHDRRKLAGKERQGFQCNHYDPEDEKFTKPYEWKYCDKGMEIGQTYEVHWPHSAAGACNTPNQYQSPFYDGVFCKLPLDVFLELDQQSVANSVGVQGQVFVIVNDDSYYYPDLIKGMIVDADLGIGTDLAIYTGSSTGTKRNNEICSPYSPITWQVDRKCHLISATSFDKMCADMMSQRDDMSSDLEAHGSRELVVDILVANNHANLRT
jgi:hypothetical protein